MLFITADPTPALSTGTEPMTAAADGFIVQRHAEAADEEALAGD
jgi:hypothetical protein